MPSRTKSLALLAGAAIVTGGAFAATGLAWPPDASQLASVPTANTKSDGYAPASRLSPQLRQIVVAQGSTKLENPSSLTSYYGYFNDVLNAAGEPQMLPTPTTATEAQKSEPDKNTYLVFRNSLTGADPSYDYGTHFLFQGHELGVNGASYITRINLDADAAHRVTLLATKDSQGDAIAPIDGSTWDPFAKRLLFTTESSSAPTYSATPGCPVDRHRHLGRARPRRLRGDPERLQRKHLDRRGHRWRRRSRATNAKRPNSFLYRYVPKKPGDLAHGKLQALQVLNGTGRSDHVRAARRRSTVPISLPCTPTARRSRRSWVTVHDTADDGTAPFNANDAAKARRRTPFKRPENGLFRPGSRLPRVLLRRDRRHRHHEPGERDRGRLDVDLEAHAVEPEFRPRSDHASSTRAIRRTRASTTSRSCPRTRSRSSRTPATRCTRSATRSIRATSSTSPATTRTRRT